MGAHIHPRTDRRFQDRAFQSRIRRRVAVASDLVKPSLQIRRDAEALLRFREAYVALVNASRPHQPTFITQLGRGVPQDEWNRLRTEVSLSAGRAEPAYHRHGGIFSVRNAAYTMSGVSPVTNWEMSLRDPDQLPPHAL